MCFRKKTWQLLLVIFALILWNKNAFSLTKAFHFKQLGDDGHTFILYSLRCASENRKNCNLQALAVSDDKAKNSCYIVYKTIFKNKSFKLQTNGSYFITVMRDKCNDLVHYIFSPKNLTFISQFKETNLKSAPISDERCEIFKATRNEGVFLSQEPIIPQIGFGGCTTFTFRMDD